MNRRNFIKLASAFSLASGLSERSVAQEPGQATSSQAPAPPASDGVAFSEQWLFTQAENLARKPFAAPELKLPSELADLDQQKYQAIRYKADAAVWKDDPFNFDLQFFHTGFQYKVPVEIHLIEAGVARPFPYSTSLFEFGAPLTVPPADSQSGFSGLRRACAHPPPRCDGPVPDLSGRQLFPLDRDRTGFRHVGACREHQHRAVLRRGIPVFPRAVDPKAGGRPTGSSSSMRFSTGRASPASTNSAQSQAASRSWTWKRPCFPRKVLTHVGIAPLTSMYYFGTADGTKVDDYRPNVLQLQRLADLDRHG